MTQRTVQLSSDGVRHRVVIGGTDLSAGLQGLRLELVPGQLPTVVLDPIISNLPGGDLRQAEVIVSDQAAAALQALGWTPPADAVGGD